MKNLLYSSFFLVCVFSYGQNSEFKVYDNGFIYSDDAIGKLKHIVDSLNLKFKVCDISKKFNSKLQGKAHFIEISDGNILQAKKDIESNMAYEAFKKKYHKADYDENLLIFKEAYIDYEDKNVIRYSNLRIGKGASHSLYDSDGTMKQVGNWIFSYHQKGEYVDEGIEAYYLTEKLESKPLPQKYARLIHYSDCLVDTTAQVFKANAKDSGIRYYDSIPNKADKFNRYVEKVLKRPEFDYSKYGAEADTMTNEKFWKKVRLTKKEKKRRDDIQKQAEEAQEVYWNQYQKWEATRLARVDSLKQADPNFMPMLRDALVEVQSSHASDDAFEEYVGRYIAADDELELKRNRRVVGGCSMDSRPRIHALNIALLSAETTKWEIFLRSHLDIMNDRFDRVSDGSWAYGARETYIKELEVLDINVPDLIFGISLRVDNPAENHYFGSINRIGRALSESNNSVQIETAMLDMIADNDLDDFNRVIIYFLFDNYNYNVKDESRKKRNIEKLKTAVAKMPAYVYSKIDFEE